MIFPGQQSAPPGAPAEPPLRPSGNLHMGSNPLGMWLDVPRAGADFRHPWLVRAGSGRARVGVGYVVNEMGAAEATMEGGVKLSSRPAPFLTLDPELVNDQNESWVCVEVAPDDDGGLGEGSLVECVQRPTPYVTTGTKGRAPLALLLWVSGRWQVWQVAFFHFFYTTTVTAEGRKHFFR